MSGIGPVEPGDGTRARDAPAPDPPPAGGPPRRRPPWLHGRFHRGVLTAAAATLLLAGGGYLYATRPQTPPPPAPSAPAYPSQVTTVVYLHPEATPRDAPTRSFSFSVRLSVRSGPPVTVTRLTQPYAGLSLTTAPGLPFRTKAGSSRKIIINAHVTECGKTPENAGLPFLDLTLRNTRAKETHGFILGARYAQDLSGALHVACGNHAK
ncbi:Tat pathway signal sequence domain protein [Streptomyces nodosus]|uniref:Tat pathway signal sequence domain protein n=1 Tax=Streptomyces nodosus TaxID=40318 RepID=UPI003456FC61